MFQVMSEMKVWSNSPPQIEFKKVSKADIKYETNYHRLQLHWTETITNLRLKVLNEVV